MFEISAVEIVKRFKFLFEKRGAPKELISDNGTQLVSQITKDFLKSWGVKHKCTPVHFPQENGYIERMNRNIKNRLRESEEENKLEAVGKFLADYHTTHTR